ncbi:hypothetical protein BDV25DRAFT_171026 [Aspergillus avenaceus]|uniref:Uncharacterized protein n=1 Tax=Aspergillus avenaceus TaxID=36643 RepID=A0A5N6U0Y8_ASPAV|nr:hypothetical protein BDV25DRAFT_171026 [Aspergillus avenaceus]
MAQTETVHVISKTDNRQHAVVHVDVSSVAGELAPSTIRVRPHVLSLSTNNLTYALLGTMLHWWDAYPVPAAAPAPYNDSSAWGIVPAWGFAKVLESTTEIAPGSLLWGFWPTSSLPTELKVAPGTPRGHWIEASEHRKQLMTVYNRFIEVSEEDRDRMGWSAAFRTLWSAGYWLSDYVFSSAAGSPVHPLGNRAGVPWTGEDADLSSAVVVNLGASTKTARCFTYNLLRRSKGLGPLGVLQVTSSPEALKLGAEKQGVKQGSLPGLVNALAYSDLGSAVPWLKSLGPSKLVVVDCGARGDALARLHRLVQEDAVLRECKLVTIQVGLQQKVYTGEELLEFQAAMKAYNQVQSNASDIQDAAIELEGAEAFFTRMSQRWEQWLDDREVTVPDMRLVWGKGVTGAEGVFGGWERLVKGEVQPEEAQVYMI